MKGSPSVRKAQFRHGSVVILALLTSCFEVSEDSPGGDPDTGLSAGSGAPATCGNGALDPGEECDDGILSVSGACVPGCKRATCGDGHLWLEREVCDDGNNSNEDDCVDCSPARCGDGYVWAGREDCDDGNWFNGDSCPATCRFSESNDATTGGMESQGTESTAGESGLVEDSETAQDSSSGINETDTEGALCVCETSDEVCLAGGEVSPDDPCQECNVETGRLTARGQGAMCGVHAMCLSGECREVRRVFVTPPFASANINSDDADEVCASIGQRLDEQTRWLAWMSGPASAPEERFEHFDGPYVNVLGNIVADDWFHLVSSQGRSVSLRGPIDIDVWGMQVRGFARTGVAAEGTVSENCESWARVEMPGQVGFRSGLQLTYGVIGNVNFTWTENETPCYPGIFTPAMSVYCFEQVP